MPLDVPIQLAFPTHSAMTTANPTLLAGQLIIVSNTSSSGPDDTTMYYCKVGTGAAYNSTPFASFGDAASWAALLAQYVQATLVTDPTLAGATDAQVASALAVKTLIDDRIAGVAWKDEVRVRTTANITLSGTQTIDSVALSVDDRVLVMNQSTATQNGLYLVKSGAWVRTDDASTGMELSWATVTVVEGTIHAGTRWNCNVYPITIGSTNITWVSFGGGTYTADGTSLDLTGGQFSVKADGITASKLAHAVLKAVAGVGTTPVSGHVPRMTGASTAELMLVTDQSKDLLALTTIPQWLANLGALLNQVTAASANFTVSAGGRGQLYNVTTAASTITVTLPSASGNNGFAVLLRKADTGAGTVITSPATSTLKHEGDHMSLVSDGTNWLVVQEPSPTMAILYFGATGNTPWTNQLAALAFFYDLPRAIRVDLTGRRLIRLTGLVHTIGHTTAKLILRYRASYSTTTTDYSDFTTEVSIAISATGGVSSGWVTIPTAAQADVYVTVLGSGGNGVADPIVSSLMVEVH